MEVKGRGHSPDASLVLDQRTLTGGAWGPQESVARIQGVRDLWWGGVGLGAKYIFSIFDVKDLFSEHLHSIYYYVPVTSLSPLVTVIYLAFETIHEGVHCWHPFT